MLYASLTAPPMFGLRTQIDRLFDETFGTNGSRATTWTPATDVREDEKAIVFEMELPGVAPEQVHVTAEKGVLTITGEKAMSEAARAEQNRWHIFERAHGAFTRSFQLPQTVNESAIEATFSAGVLTVRIEKTPPPQPRKIEIRTA